MTDQPDQSGPSAEVLRMLDELEKSGCTFKQAIHTALKLRHPGIDTSKYNLPVGEDFLAAVADRTVPKGREVEAVHFFLVALDNPKLIADCSKKWDDSIKAN